MRHVEQSTSPLFDDSRSTITNFGITNRHRVWRHRLAQRYIILHASSSVNKQFRSTTMVSFNSFGDTTYRFWRKAIWVSNSDVDGVFILNEKTGHVTVLQPGVSLIYAQMVHHDLTTDGGLLEYSPMAERWSSVCRASNYETPVTPVHCIRPAMASTSRVTPP